MNNQRTYNILLGAPISEKSPLVAASSNPFLFKVAKDASRPSLKRAVEQIYGVSVDSVSVANVKGKVKRTMRGLSKRASWKKAYVRVAAGQEIDFTAEAK